MFNLLGSSARDFFLNPLYAGSGASGNRAVTFAGNDILYYSQGAVQTIAGSEAFGDVEVDDFSRPIKAQMSEPFRGNASGDEAAPEATLSYSTAANTLFVHRLGETYLWAFDKSLQDQKAKDVSLLREGSKLSAWTKVSSAFSTGLWGAHLNSSEASALYFASPFIMTEGTINAWASMNGNSGTQKVLKTLLVGTPEGVVYYLDTEHDSIANRDSYTSDSLIPDGTDIINGFVDLRPYTEYLTVSHTSKVFNAPSGVEIKNLTGVINYVPRETIEPVITVRIEFQGRRRRTISKQITLYNNPDAGDYRKKSRKFSMQSGKATAMQVTVSWNSGELVEILGIDFTLNA